MLQAEWSMARVLGNEVRDVTLAMEEFGFYSEPWPGKQLIFFLTRTIAWSDLCNWVIVDIVLRTVHEGRDGNRENI